MKFICTFAAVTALAFCLGDALMIPLVMRPLFEAALGPAMLETLRLGPAAAFYAIHIGGIVYFAGIPAARGGSPFAAARDGAILGLVAYSCYEMTSWTIMRDWSVWLVLPDVAWGMVLSGASAWIGARIARQFFARHGSA